MRVSTISTEGSSHQSYIPDNYNDSFFFYNDLNLRMAVGAVAAILHFMNKTMTGYFSFF